MMFCADVIKHLYEFMDGEIDEPNHLTIQKHVNHCGECRQRYEIERDIRSLIKSCGKKSPAPPHLYDRIIKGLNAIDLENTRLTDKIIHPDTNIIQNQKTEKRILFSSRFFTIAASFLLAVAMSIFYYSIYHKNSLSIVDSAVENHVVAVNDNNLVFNEKTSVVGNINDYLEREINTKLESSSPILGAKQVRVVGGIPVRLGSTDSSCVIFDKGGNKLSLQTIHNNRFPMKNLKRVQLDSKEFYVGNCRGFNSVLWQENDLIYCLTSDINIKEILKFAEALTSY
ncbi:MAG: mycothiol system anti-sigma-R factor [wastewater metagenome]|nr:mycothiol system anti-sigma-R factor [Candidatus Loosdrechtia aerotolerans]